MHMTDVYDEFGMFHENADEFGIPWRGAPDVRRVEVSVGGGQTISALWRARANLNLRGFIYYAWRDGRPYAPRFKDFWGLHTGLLRANGSAKPAFAAFKKAVAGLG